VRSIPPALKAAVVAVCVLAGTGRADDELATWLEKTVSTERWESDVVARRSDPELAARLFACAGDARLGEPVRRRALVLLGAIEDRRDVADVRSFDPVAADRIEVRAALLGRLEDALARTSEEGVTAADVTGYVAATPGAEEAVAREAVALARDPLFGARKRGVLVRLLPELAKAAGADPLAVATAIVAQHDRDGGEARMRALALLEDRSPRDALARVLAGALDDPDPRVLARVDDAMPLLASSAESEAPDGPLAVFAGLALSPGASIERRARAVEALGRTRSAAATPWIENALRQAAPVTEDRVRAAALVALGRTAGRPPGEIAGRLVELLASSAAESQDRAIDGLGELPQGTVEDVLRPRLVPPASDLVRTRTAQAARALALKGLAPELIQLVRADGASLAARTAGIRALEVTGDPREAALALGYVLETAFQTPESASLRRAAALALGSPALRGEAARAALAKALQDYSPLVRIAALRALGSQGDASAESPLLGQVARTDLAPRERAQAIRALDELSAHEDDVARRVSSAVEEDPSPEVAIAGADFLARSARAVAIPALLRLLESSDPGVRERAHASLLARTDVAAQADQDPFGYDPSPRAPRAERTEAVKRWREWWEVHRDR
jgi:HEAT repeat protein